MTANEDNTHLRARTVEREIAKLSAADKALLGEKVARMMKAFNDPNLSDREPRYSKMERRGQRPGGEQPETMKRKATIRKSRKVRAGKRKPDSLHCRVRRPDRELELYEMRRYMI